MQRAKKPFPLDLMRLMALATYQFGRGVGEKMMKGTIRIQHSPNTGRIRYIYRRDKLIGTIRTHDGYIALTPIGGEYLRRILKPPRYRVVVQDDVAPFIKRGGDVFAKHVQDCDDEIRPGEEVLVVDGKDHLLAVGRAFFSGLEMRSFRVGVAVKVRRGTGK